MLCYGHSQNITNKSDHPIQIMTLCKTNFPIFEWQHFSLKKKKTFWLKSEKRKKLYLYLSAAAHHKQIKSSQSFHFEFYIATRHECFRCSTQKEKKNIWKVMFTIDGKTYGNIDATSPNIRNAKTYTQTYNGE